MSSSAKSFYRTLLFNMSMLVALAICMLGLIWIFQEHLSYTRQAELIRSAQLAARKAELKARVENIVDYIGYKKTQARDRMQKALKARVTEAEVLTSNLYAACSKRKDSEGAQPLAREILRSLGCDGGRGCFLALSLSGTVQLCPENPALEGMNVSELRDGEGRPVFKELITLAQTRKEGFCTYNWAKAEAGGREFTKICYVKYFPPLDWLIASSAYLDDQELAIRQEVLARITEMNANHHDGGRIIIGQWDGVILAGAGKGENLPPAGSADSTGTGQKIIALAKKGGGFIDETSQVNYVIGVDEWQWYVRASEPLDDLETALGGSKRFMANRLLENIAAALGVLACLLCASFFIARRIARKTRNSFAGLNRFFHSATSQAQPLDSRSLDFIEFQQLAESVSLMVAERNRFMTELKENERRYRSLFDSAGDAIFIIRDSVFIDCNQRALTMFTCPREKLIGQSPVRFSPVTQPDGTDSSAKMAEKTGLTLSGIPQIFEWTHQRCDGSFFDAEISLTALELAGTTCIQAIIRDSTDRKQVEKQLVRQASAMAQTAEEIIITDPAGAIEYVNPAFEQITGYAAAEAIGSSYSMLENGPDKQAYAEMWAAIRAGNVWRGRIATRKRDGGLLAAEATVSPISAPNGGPMGYVFVKRDMTEQLKTETMFRQSQKMEAIGTLAGGIAHDFNNILSAIFGFAEIAKLETPETSNAYRSLDKILEAAGRARDLVKQILTFSRQTDLKPQPIQPKLIIKETIKLLEASLPSTIEIRANLQSSESVMADPTSIHQIIMNLCTNAGHAMRKSGGILGISLIAVELDQDFARIHPQIKPGQFLRLAISDTGHGMTQEVRERIFDPFFTTKAEGEGTGMGLSVTHGIIRSLGGTIAVQSEPGKGSTFSVYLPVHLPQQLKKIEEAEQVPQGTEHIVFVDDEEFIVEIAQQMLELLGYRVVGKTDSREALAYFEDHANEIDLVITDLTMPHLTGLDLTRKIREIRPALPVLLCTGYHTGFTEEELKEAGINALILKPVVRKELAAVVRRVLDTGRKGG